MKSRVQVSDPQFRAGARPLEVVVHSVLFEEKELLEMAGLCEEALNPFVVSGAYQNYYFAVEVDLLQASSRAHGLECCVHDAWAALNERGVQMYDRPAISDGQGVVVVRMAQRGTVTLIASV